MIEKDYLLESYDYDLPKSFMAQRPVFPRDSSKLLVYNKKSMDVQISTFSKLPSFFTRPTLFVFNQTKVIPTRLIVKKISGAKTEIFFLDLTPPVIHGHYNVFIKSSRSKKIGDEFTLPFSNIKNTKIISCNTDSTFTIYVDIVHDELINELKNHALLPIPPYIRKGCSDSHDSQDYQTVYSKEEGSVAAPTAGLHFTQDLLDELKKNDHHFAYVNLYVGAGTFLPVKTKDIREHPIHRENFFIDKENFSKINNWTGDIVCIGTTSIRVLESMKQPDIIDSTNIFIYPGKVLTKTQSLITNFHLPCSSLIMLVSAIIGREKTLELYELAKEENFRFYSYGDAMLILDT